MKTLTKRMVSIMLVIVLVFSFITPAFAVDNVTVSGKAITVGDTKYSCNTKASELTDEQQKEAERCQVFPSRSLQGNLLC